MSKNKKDDYDDDIDLDLDFEDEFDGMGDDAFSMTPPPDNRKPMVQAADGFVSGAKDAFLNEANLRKAVRASMPSAIGESIDTVDNVATDLGDIYRHARDELKPTFITMKRSANAMNRALGPLIPDSVSKWIDDKTKADEDGSSGTPSEEQVMEGNIASTLAGIFEKQAEQDHQDRQTEQVMNVVETKQRAQTANMSAQMATDIKKIVLHQDKITLPVQKKMLELAMRQTFYQGAILKELKAHAQSSKQMLQNIQYNSSLPDIAKAQKRERIKDLMLARTFHAVTDGLNNKLTASGMLGAMTKKAKGAISDKITNTIKEAAGAAEQAMDAIGEMQSGATMEAEMSGVELTAEQRKAAQLKHNSDMAGGMAADAGLGFIAKRVKSFLENNPKMAGAIARSMGFNQNLGYNANSLLKTGFNEKDDDNWLVTAAKKLGNGTIDFLDLDQAVARESSSKISHLTKSNMFEIAEFSNYAHASLTQIIPGYLSRILRSSESIRQGFSFDQSADLLEYDFDRNTFVTSKSAKDSWLRKASDAGNSMTRYIKDLMVELTGDEKFDFRDDAEREAISNAIMREKRKGNEFSIKDIFENNPDVSETVKGMVEENLEKKGLKVTDNMHKVYLDKDRAVNTVSAANKVSKMFNDLDLGAENIIRDMLNDSRAGMTQMDLYRELGILDRNNTIDKNKLYDLILKLNRSEIRKKVDKENKNLREDKGWNPDLGSYGSSTPKPKPKSPTGGGGGTIGMFSSVHNGINNEDIDNDKGYNPDDNRSTRSRNTGKHVRRGDSGNRILNKISKGITNIFELLKKNLQKKQEQAKPITSENARDYSDPLAMINGSINAQTQATLQAMDRLNMNVIAVAKFAGGDRAVDWEGMGIRPDEITSNLINWNKLFRYGRETANWTWETGKSAFNFAKEFSKNGIKFLDEKVLSPTVGFLGRMRDKVLTMDLYLPENMMEPVLKARDFANGLYLDKQGNIIRSLRDIKGNIYRAGEDGQLILVVTYEELRDRVVDITGKYVDLTRFKGIIKKWGGDALKFIREKAPLLNPMNAINAVKDIAKKAYYRTKELVMNDIYVGTERHPRITGTQLMTGAFLCKGKPLFRAKDIVDDVYDLNGNLVLSIEEVYNKGLFDKNGKPYKDVLDSALSRVSSALGMGLGFVQSGWERLKSFGRSVAEIAKNFANGLFGNIELGIGIGTKWTKRIYELLAWKFKGAPEHHKDDIEKDDIRKQKFDPKLAAGDLQDKAEKYADTVSDWYENREQKIKDIKAQAKKKADKTYETLNKLSGGHLGKMNERRKKYFGSEENEEEKMTLKERFAAWRKDPKGNAKDASKDLKRKLHGLYGFLNETSGGRLDGANAFRKKRKEEFDKKYGKNVKDAEKLASGFYERVTKMISNWVPYDSLSDDLKFAVNEYPEKEDKLWKLKEINGKDTLMINLKLLLKLEKERMRKQAKADGYGDDVAARDLPFLARLNWQKNLYLKEFQRKRKKRKEEKSKNKNEREKTKREIDEEKRRKKQSRLGSGLINRFTGKLRRGSWRTRGGNTNKSGADDKKPDVDHKGNPTGSWFGKMKYLLGAIAGGIFALPKLLGKVIYAPFKLLGGVLNKIPMVGKLLGSAVRGVGWLASGGAKTIAGAVVRAPGAIVRGAVAIGSSALTAVNAVAATASSVVTAVGWPVILGAAAVGAAAYGAYKLWEMFRDEITPVDEFRMATYGINANNDKDKYNRLLAFEKELEKNSKFDKNGSFILGKVDHRKMAALFWDVPRSGELTKDVLESEQLPRYMNWFKYRFFPNFKRHEEALEKIRSSDIDGWSKIDGLYNIDDDMRDKYKPAFVRMATAKESDQSFTGSGYYAFEGLPFSDMPDGALPYNQVKVYSDNVINKYADDEKSDVGWKGALFGSDRDIVGDNGRYNFENEWVNGKSTEERASDGKAIWKAKDPKAIKGVHSDNEKVTIINDKGEAKEVTYGSMKKSFKLEGGAASDWQMVRFALYGLSEPIELNNALSVLKLEQNLAKKFIRVDSTDANSKEITIVKDDAGWNEFVKETAAEFGWDPKNKSELEAFSTFLQKRTLPAVSKVVAAVLNKLWDQKIAVDEMDKPNVEDLDDVVIDLFGARDGKKIFDIGGSLFKDKPATISFASIHTYIENIKAEKKSTTLRPPMSKKKMKSMIEKFKNAMAEEMKKRRGRIALYTTDSTDLSRLQPGGNENSSSRVSMTGGMEIIEKKVLTGKANDFQRMRFVTYGMPANAGEIAQKDFFRLEEIVLEKLIVINDKKVGIIDNPGETVAEIADDIYFSMGWEGRDGEPIKEELESIQKAILNRVAPALQKWILSINNFTKSTVTKESKLDIISGSEISGVASSWFTGMFSGAKVDSISILKYQEGRVRAADYVAGIEDFKQYLELVVDKDYKGSTKSSMKWNKTASLKITNSNGRNQPATVTQTSAYQQRKVEPVSTADGASLLDQTNDAIKRGVKYTFSSKDSASGGVDCSGWIKEINTKFIRGMDADEEAKKQAMRMFPDGAAMIVRDIHKVTNEILPKEMMSYDSIPNGMIIGEDHGQKKWDKGRFLGIDHIVQVITGKDGRKMVTQSSSGKGVNLIPLETYLKKRLGSQVKLFGVDTNYALSKLTGKGIGDPTGSPEVNKTVSDAVSNAPETAPAPSSLDETTKGKETTAAKSENVVARPTDEEAKKPSSTVSGPQKVGKWTLDPKGLPGNYALDKEILRQSFWKGMESDYNKMNLPFTVAGLITWMRAKLNDKSRNGTQNTILMGAFNICISKLKAKFDKDAKDKASGKTKVTSNVVTHGAKNNGTPAPGPEKPAMTPEQIKAKNIADNAVSLGVPSTTTTEAPVGVEEAIKASTVSASKDVVGGDVTETITGFDEKETQVFLESIVSKESGGDLDAVNQFGYLGLYQMGASALAEAGMIKMGNYRAAVQKYGKKLSAGTDRKVHYGFLADSNNWTISGGINQFLNDKSTQDTAMIRYTNKNASYLEKKGSLAGDKAKRFGVLHAAHLVGIGGANKFVKQGIDKADGNGTSASSYYKHGVKTYEEHFGNNASKTSSVSSGPTSTQSASNMTNINGGGFSTSYSDISSMGNTQSMSPTGMVADATVETTKTPEELHNEKVALMKQQLDATNKGVDILSSIKSFLTKELKDVVGEKPETPKSKNTNVTSKPNDSSTLPSQQTKPFTGTEDVRTGPIKTTI